MFCKDDIIKLSSRSSFSRGKDYYENGYIKGITCTENSFEGTVLGSQLYKVKLDLENGVLNFHCSCPYDHGGLCKHEISLALAILNDEYNEKIENMKTSLTDKEEFNRCYLNTDKEKKISFLKHLLDKDSDLQNQFISFIKSKSEDLDKIIGVNIDEIKEDTYEQLAEIDFDSIVEDHDPYNDGYYDDEGYIDTANDEISSVFDPYKNEAIEYVKKGNLLDAVRIMLGLYEGTQNLPELEDNEYEVFYESYDSVAFDLLKETFREIILCIEQIVIADELVFKALDLFFQRCKEVEIKYFDQEEQVIYNLRDFEKFFLSIIKNKNIAEYFYEIIRKNELESIDLAFVLLEIAKLKQDEEMWIENAEKFSGFNPEIAKQLLEKYKLINRENDFNKIAELAFRKWADSFDLFLINNLNKESKKELYIEALKSYTKNKHSLPHYIELREYLNEKQKNEFADEVLEGYYHDIFYIQILDIEKRFEDILAFVRRKNDSYDFELLIAPIINIYPDECFNIIRIKCNAAMNNYNRNRSTYQQMVKWLEVMSRIKSKQEETKQHIKILFEHKPNLPALKDEFRKARLI